MAIFHNNSIIMLSNSPKGKTLKHIKVRKIGKTISTEIQLYDEEEVLRENPAKILEDIGNQLPEQNYSIYQSTMLPENQDSISQWNEKGSATSISMSPKNMTKSHNFYQTRKSNKNRTACFKNVKSKVSAQFFAFQRSNLKMKDKSKRLNVSRERIKTQICSVSNSISPAIVSFPSQEKREKKIQLIPSKRKSSIMNRKWKDSPEELSLQKKMINFTPEKSQRVHDLNWSIRGKLDSLYRSHKLKLKKYAQEDTKQLPIEIKSIFISTTKPLKKM